MRYEGRIIKFARTKVRYEGCIIKFARTKVRYEGRITKFDRTKNVMQRSHQGIFILFHSVLFWNRVETIRKTQKQVVRNGVIPRFGQSLTVYGGANIVQLVEQVVGFKRERKYVFDERTTEREIPYQAVIVHGSIRISAAAGEAQTVLYGHNAWQSEVGIHTICKGPCAEVGERGAMARKALPTIVGKEGDGRFAFGIFRIQLLPQVHVAHTAAKGSRGEAGGFGYEVGAVAVIGRNVGTEVQPIQTIHGLRVGGTKTGVPVAVDVAWAIGGDARGAVVTARHGYGLLREMPVGRGVHVAHTARGAMRGVETEVVVARIAQRRVSRTDVGGMAVVGDVEQMVHRGHGVRELVGTVVELRLTDLHPGPEELNA